MRPSRRTRLFLRAVFAALLAVAPAARWTRGTALAERVIDGATIRVRMAGAPYTVRLTGVARAPFAVPCLPRAGDFAGGPSLLPRTGTPSSTGRGPVPGCARHCLIASWPRTRRYTPVAHGQH